jgi:pimeloyl-ACP methyl ester carboxylesterase
VAAAAARLDGEATRLFLEMSWRRPAPPLPGTPTLVVAPERDESLAVWRQRRLARRMHADLLVAAGLGHSFPLEPRGDQVAQRVITWLEDVVAPNSHE